MSENEQSRVCWVVPGFAESDDDPRYSFLRREAHELVDFADVDLTVVVDGPWDGAQGQGFGVRQLRRPATLREKARTLWSAFRADPGRILSFLRDPRGAYPVLWRVGTLARFAREWRPDVVHSHFAAPAGTCGVPVARATRALSVVSLRGVDIAIDEGLGYGFRRNPRYDREIRSSLARVDLCLTATAHMRTLAIGAGAKASTALLLPNSVATGGDSVAQVSNRPAGSRRMMVSVGHLTERKGFDRGVRALALLPSDHHYVIVGEGVERDTLTRLAAELGVADRTHLIGEVSPEEARSWMEDADCYWFLSRFEAFGNVLIEAFAAGVPIIATAEGVAPELAVHDASVVLLTEPDDPSALANLTNSLPDESALEGREELLRRFSPETRSSDLVGLYERSRLMVEAQDRSP